MGNSLSYMFSILYVKQSYSLAYTEVRNKDNF